MTRHDGNLEEELNQFHLINLFDRVIQIGQQDCKVKYIDNKNSIFIDDSFEERRHVIEQRHIPVFSIDMIGCLM